MSERMVLELPEQVARQARAAAAAGNRRVEEVLVDWLNVAAAEAASCPCGSSDKGAEPQTVPVRISTEAAAHLWRLGLERERNRIVAQIQQTAPNLLAIEIESDYDPNAPVQDRLIIQAVVPAADPIDLRWENDLTRWFLESYPPAITMHFLLTTRYEAGHGR